MTKTFGAVRTQLTALAATLTTEAHDHKSFNYLVLSNETWFNAI